jgi:branched-chain amino acid transport system ATP-binding protein
MIESSKPIWGGTEGKKLMLKVQDVDAYYGRMMALAGISLHVKESEIVTIIGPNGSGKTTTLRTLFGLIIPKEGTILFKGEHLEKEPAQYRAKRGISFVPEGARVFSRLSVLENLELGAYSRKDKKEAMTELETIYTMFPIVQSRQKSRAGTLSGGERQMLAISRSLMLKPILLLMDEPSLGLGPIIVDEIYKKIQEIREKGVTILLVEQNALKALQIADRGYVYRMGKIVLEGTGGELLENEHVKKTFLGG